jgi:hypothetical protein
MHLLTTFPQYYLHENSKLTTRFRSFFINANLKPTSSRSLQAETMGDFLGAQVRSWSFNLALYSLKRSLVGKMYESKPFSLLKSLHLCSHLYQPRAPFYFNKMLIFLLFFIKVTLDACYKYDTSQSA